MVDAAVALHDTLFIVPRLLKLPVDVGGEDEPLLFSFRRLQQHRETGMGHRFAVEVQSMAIEGPRQRRICLEPVRIGQLDEAQPPLFRRRVGAPEPFVTSEIGQAGVDPHPRPGGDEQGVGLFQGVSGHFDIADSLLLFFHSHHSKP